MKFKSAAVVFTLFMVGLVSAQENEVFTDKGDKVSYSIGVNIGNNVKNSGDDLNMDLLFKGIRDVLSEKQLMMTTEEMRESMMDFQKESMAKNAGQMKTLGEKNKKAGEVFLTENKKKEGVVALHSGIQYMVLRAGSGRTPKDTDSVTVNYRTTLIDGTECFSTHSRNEPPTFPVNSISPYIKGFVEALKIMQVGAKWQLFIPSTLAYGERGAGEIIGPNSTLIIEVELISIKDERGQ